MEFRRVLFRSTVYRLWEEAATAALPRFDPPEILEADLSALLLDCALWGVTDPRALQWIDPPPAAAIDEARKRLLSLGAFDERGRPTAHGKPIAPLPPPPPPPPPTLVAHVPRPPDRPRVGHKGC